MTEPRTLYLLKRIEALSRAQLDDKLRVLGLSAGQYTTLSLLGRNDGLSSADLARRAMISPQSMFEVISALEKKGLIIREANDQNRRILFITMTPSGQDLLDRAQKLVDLIEDSMFAAIDPSSYASLRESLIMILKAHNTAGSMI